MPIDGYPVLGASPARKDVYLAVTHSGVTLAPIFGECVAQEIVDGELAESLKDFRPDRKFVAKHRTLTGTRSHLASVERPMKATTRFVLLTSLLVSGLAAGAAEPVAGRTTSPSTRPCDLRSRRRSS